MQIGEVRVGYVSHVTFMFGADDGTLLLADPYFCGKLEWRGKTERHLQMPDIRPESIDRCSAIFVSHIHGDHCDLNAIELIAKRTSARVLAPPEVLDLLAPSGLPDEALIPLHDGQTIQLGAFGLEILGGYDRSFDERGRMNKFSLLLEHRGTRLSRLWYSGDCHALPPALNGRQLDAVFSWTSPDALSELARLNPPPKRFVVMHTDRHEPGDFWCNKNAGQEARAVSQSLPGVEVIVPNRLGAFSSFDCDTR